MPELRKDPVVGRWVIVASERSKRPGVSFFTASKEGDREYCPFCEGRETQTPGEVLAFRDPPGSHDAPGWWVRVVPNKFPALERHLRDKRMGMGIYDMMNGVGAHEVVIETPDHDMHMADMPQKQIEEILWCYRERMLQLHNDLRLRYILVFKNYGSEAGATLDHPHSQIIGLPIVPKRVQEEMEGAEEYFRYKERCVFCDVIHQEERDKERLLYADDLFVAFHPFSSRFPYETWIVPREHGSMYNDIQVPEVRALAKAMKQILQRYRIVLNDPPFNFVIHTSPFTKGEVPYYHWHIELIPCLTRVAGFEWGTGFYINPVSPEDAAQHMLAESVTASLPTEPPAPLSSHIKS
jgi:UDPglucose--hexose-1-phosphate uridylyltransferase